MRWSAIGAFVAAAAVAVGITVAEQDQLESLEAQDCHAFGTRATCVQEHCVWCKCAAVPSACYNKTEASQLPPAVFDCEDRDQKKKTKHAPVFLSNVGVMPLQGTCHDNKSRDTCLHAHCAWCKSAAVRSACYEESEAGQLPPAVFECELPSQDDDKWAIQSTPKDAEAWETLFQTWKREFKKQYALAIDEQVRSNVFQHNAHLIAAHNANPASTFTMELNEFADLTWGEFKQLYLSAPQSCSATHSAQAPTSMYQNVPETKDWRDDGMVSPVKNQGKCGSCWAFSSTGCLESHVKIKHGHDVTLSEQNLLDCAGHFDTHGCEGGLPSHAFEYVKYNGGIDFDATYPYEAKQGKCKFNTYHIGAQVEQVVNITARDELELRTAVGTTGPVSVAFQVVDDFRFYKRGVYSSTTCRDGEQDVNHAVLAVGYGMEASKRYWLIKNSWGTTWGMDGFFKIERDRNMCGIADCASYPVVK